MLALARPRKHEPHEFSPIQPRKDSDRLSQDDDALWRTSCSTVDSVEHMEKRTYTFLTLKKLGRMWEG